MWTSELPKTRSGKIMRRLLRDIAEGRMLGDTTTLADSNVVAELRDRAVAEASPFDALPAAYSGSSATIEFWFTLKR